MYARRWTWALVITLMLINAWSERAVAATDGPSRAPARSQPPVALPSP
jgi:hypothetical protein